jgi:uncharacterized protein
MAVDWAAFTPGPATVGGALIGLAAALLILGAGRVAGIAGIVGGALRGLLARRRPGHDALRWAFLFGLALAPWLWRLVAPLPAAHSMATIGVLIAAGLLVGVGVRMGSGCTSGHGVCGLARLSLRSLVNVLAFVGAGFATVAVMRHVLGM